MHANQQSASQMSERSWRHHQCLFRPRSIAVIGASGDVLKPGGRVFKTLLAHGFTGDLWPVNPKASAIGDRSTYPTIAALPTAPDLAIVAIPAALAVSAVAELAARGTGAAIVLTSGFGEKDAAGKAAENQLKAVADAAGMALIGPNCSGFITAAYKGKFAGIVPSLPGGAVDFISGSGATVDYVMEYAQTRGLSFGTVLNLGNSVQMGVEDLLRLYDEHYGPEDARILLLYLESVKKPRLLLQHAISLAAKGCHLVAIKSGVTSAGSRAAASHTGAMATSDSAVQALFDKAGIIRVTSRQTLVDVACLLQALHGTEKNLRTGRRVAIVTDAGGPGVMLADELARNGLQVPALGAAARLALAAILPPEGSTINPIDALPSRTAGQFTAIIDTLAKYERDNIDAIALLTGDSGLSDNTAIYQAIAAAMESSPIPVLPMFSSLSSCQEKIAAFTAAGHIFFPDEVALGQALALVANQPPPAPGEETPLPGYHHSKVAAILGQIRNSGSSGTALNPQTVRLVLEAAGFPLPAEVMVTDQTTLGTACQQTGFPLAMKVVGPLHKTDVGGVRLNIASLEEARIAQTALLAIPGATGVLLQPMIAGLEVICGASREGEFGHLLLFGLGGIHTEVLKDIRFALAPLTFAESRRMIDGIRSRALLDGLRGAPGMDISLLADFLVRLGRLVTDFPEIAEIDLNPVKGQGERLLVVDARIIIDTSSTRLISTEQQESSDA